jgi:hypothetical protein
MAGPKLTIKKPNRHEGTEKIIDTLEDKKPGRINMNIGRTRKKKFKIKTLDNNSDMTKVTIKLIDMYLEGKISLDIHS